MGVVTRCTHIYLAYFFINHLFWGAINIMLTVVKLSPADISTINIKDLCSIAYAYRVYSLPVTHLASCSCLDFMMRMITRGSTTMMNVTSIIAMATERPTVWSLLVALCTSVIFRPEKCSKYTKTCTVCFNNVIIILTMYLYT